MQTFVAKTSNLGVNGKFKREIKIRSLELLNNSNKKIELKKK